MDSIESNNLMIGDNVGYQSLIPKNKIKVELIETRVELQKTMAKVNNIEDQNAQLSRHVDELAKENETMKTNHNAEKSNLGQKLAKKLIELDLRNKAATAEKINNIESEKKELEKKCKSIKNKYQLSIRKIIEKTDEEFKRKDNEALEMTQQVEANKVTINKLQESLNEMQESLNKKSSSDGKEFDLKIKNLETYERPLVCE